MQAMWKQPIRDASAWLGSDFASPVAWSVTLSESEVAEARHYVESTVELPLRSAAEFAAAPEITGLDRIVDSIAWALKDGRGVSLVRGWPVVSVDDAQRLFWAVGRRLGTPVTQNADKELLGHVYDKGATGGSLNSRGFATRGGGGFHVDLSDVAGLMCIRQAMAGGESKLVSSMSIFNTILAERPDLLPILFRGFIWDRRAEQLAEEEPHTERIPVFSHASGQLSCRMHQGFIHWWSVRSGIALSAEEQEAIDYFHAVADRPGMVLSFRMQPGDMLFVNNYTVMHARTAYEDWPDPERKRYLLRLWLDVPGFRRFSDENIVRYGVLHHGHLGLSASDLLRGERGTSAPGTGGTR